MAGLTLFNLRLWVKTICTPFKPLELPLNVDNSSHFTSFKTLSLTYDLHSNLSMKYLPFANSFLFKRKMSRKTQ